MAIEEKILRDVQKLPASFREELLDFLQYLLMKVEQKEEWEWRGGSLLSALQGMENEPELYTLADIKVMFS